MNKNAERIVTAVAEIVATARNYKAVHKAARDTIFEPNAADVHALINDRKETLDNAKNSVFNILENATASVIWVTNGNKCACISTVAHENSGASDTTYAIGDIKLDNNTIADFVKSLADSGALDEITDMFENMEE